jgi:hypothetical protein
VYSPPIQNEATLQQGIFGACKIIRNLPGTFERVRQPMIRSINACIDSGGGFLRICFEL